MAYQPQILELSVTGATCFSCVTTIKGGVFTEYPEILDSTFPSPQICTLKVRQGSDPTQLLLKLNDNDFGFVFESIRLVDQSGKYFTRAKLNAILSVPLMIVSMLSLIPSPLTLAGQMVGGILSIVSLALMKTTGSDFYQNALVMLKQKKTNMNTLIALSTISAWLYSFCVAIIPSAFPVAALHYHFGAVCMILGVINFGRGLRSKAEYAAEKEMQDIVSIYQKYQPQVAYRLNLENKLLDKIHFHDIQVGDILEIKAGERFVTDGTIISNTTTYVDQKNLSGESTLVRKSMNDQVESGTLNKNITVRIKATNSGLDNNLSKRLKEVKAARSTKDNYSPLIERISKYFVPSIITIAALTGVGWFLLGPAPQLPFILKSVMSVLLCACPCALGLAAPISSSLSIYKLLEKRILVKNAAAFEEGSDIDCVIFDKTGTLTQPFIQESYFPTRQWPVDKAIQLAASVESMHRFHHPIAKAFVQKANQQKLFAATDINIAPNGISGKIDNSLFTLGSELLLKSRDINISNRYKAKSENFQKQGLSPVFIAANQQCIGVVALKQQISNEALTEIKQSFTKLREMGIKIGLLTGDKKSPALALSQTLGFDQSLVFYEKTAKDKKWVINELQESGLKVAMVGDGINDLEACAKANLSFAINSWTNAAAQADISLQGSVKDVPKFITLAKTVQTNIKQNLGWTFFYNTIGLVAATGLLYPFVGFTLNPIVASLAMALSSVCVVMNARRLSYLLENTMHVYEGHPDRQVSFWQYLKNSLGLSLESLVTSIADEPDSITDDMNQSQSGITHSYKEVNAKAACSDVGELKSSFGYPDNKPRFV